MSSITQAFQSVLEWIYRFVQDYGWSIVLFTLAFRFCLSPFDVISRRAMKKQTLDMARVQPQLDAMKAKYANDQEKLNKKTMEFYKQEHISPFGGCVGGCLPMLIQWPIFIAFYGAIRSISELEIYRIYETIKTTGVANVSRWLWVQNLWQPDTFQATVLPAYSAVSKFAVFSGVTEEAYNQVMTPLMNQYSGLVNGTYILPVLAAGASFFQGWLAANLAKTPEQRAKAKENKAAGKRDETETTNKIMQYMFPAMSFFFCMTSSAAFALYWLASNVASICSTIIIDRVFLKNMGKGDNKPKEDKGGIF